MSISSRIPPREVRVTLGRASAGAATLPAVMTFVAGSGQSVTVDLEVGKIAGARLRLGQQSQFGLSYLDNSRIQVHEAGAYAVDFVVKRGTGIPAFRIVVECGDGCSLGLELDNGAHKLSVGSKEKVIYVIDS